ncbi:MAG: putative bifunctional diguanylate cyclase/phosphodiesterase [Myxococcota bacterium]
MRLKDAVARVARGRVSPRRLFLTLLLVIFSLEAGVMLLLPLLLPPATSAWIEALSDATLLTVGSAPILWRVLIRPLRDFAVGESVRASAIVQAAADSIITIDERGTIESANRAALETFGWESEADLIGENVRVLMPEPFRSQHESKITHYLETGTTSILGRTRELVGQRRDGARFPLELAVTEVELGDRRIFTGVCRDISERKRTEEQIRRLAYYDTLTGLPNRRQFRKELERSVELARRHRRTKALLFMDLDGFKRINDGFGHTIGDRLLCDVADRFVRSVRLTDVVGLPSDDEGEVMLARLGGDEFTILLEEISEGPDAAVVARRLLKVLEEPFVIEGNRLFLSASIGIAVYPSDGESAETLLKNADTAMYHAKKRGRGSYQFFSASMNQLGTRRLSLESGLHRAMEVQGFALCYQPLRDTMNGRLTGAEALLRWEDASLGVVEATEFISVAEECGLIVPIGAWVLRTACQQLRRWSDTGFAPPRMAVNLSGHQVRHPAFWELVHGVLEEAQLEPAQLELEITESTVMQDEAIRVLTRLSEEGLAIALDDFGTGYSSLSSLRRLPIDRLKIDRTFVEEIPTNLDDCAVTRAIIAMAHRLGVRVVAEGVETLEQMEFLREHGCDEVQGFLLSTPLPADEFTRFLEREKASGGA